jgi:protein SCO1
MQNGSKAFQTGVWAALVVVLILVVILFARSGGRKSELPEYGEVQPFTLTNQSGTVVTLDDLAGKVWVADVIFSRCAGPCPKMTAEMSKLQASFPAGEPLRFITLTTDPEYDTPKVLKRYSEKFNGDAQRWLFLTGPKKEILGNLAIGSLKLGAVEKEEDQRQNENDLFIHSTMFVLVDKRGKLRGVYESLESGFQEKIQRDIKSLLGEGE